MFCTILRRQQQGLTVIGQSAKVLLQTRRLCRWVRGIRTGLLGVRFSSGQVGVGGVKTWGLGGNTAWNLRDEPRKRNSESFFCLHSHSWRIKLTTNSKRWQMQALHLQCGFGFFATVFGSPSLWSLLLFGNIIVWCLQNQQIILQHSTKILME